MAKKKKIVPSLLDEAGNPLPPRTPQQAREALRKLVRLFYDYQRLRIQAGGRSRGTVPREELEEEEQAKPMRPVIDLHAEDVITLQARSADLEALEALVLKDVQTLLDTMSFYTDVLSDKVKFRGIGPTLAGVLLSEFDIARTSYPSQFWSYAGLAPKPADRCGTCHTPQKVAGDGSITYPKIKGIKCDHSGVAYHSGIAAKPTKGEKLPYNAWLRTKLVGVMASNLLKCGSPYRKFYDDYKHRKQSAGWGMSDGHRHNAALRYMVKQLLLDLWMLWRKHEGLPIRPSYQEQYLGHTHHAEVG